MKKGKDDVSQRRQRKLVLDSLVLGVVGAISAQVFTLLLNFSRSIFLTGIAGYQAPGLPGEGGVLLEVVGSYGLLLIPVVTTIGGLIAGFLVFGLAPEAEGGGTDPAIRAFHIYAGKIRHRVAPLKILATAITLGSGGSGGREGPVTLISASLGSAYAVIMRRSEKERQILLLVGMAAGLSAIFRSPIGAAIFAVEILYRDMEYESRALLYAILASVVAYTVNGPFVDWQPLFQVPSDLAVSSLFQYFCYAVLGVACGLVATGVPVFFYKVRDLFVAIPIPPHFKPAIGGLLVGLMAMALPQILGGGYGWIQEAIDGRFTVTFLIALMLAKILSFTLTVSSGGSGGVFGPTLFIGAMLGGALAEIFHLPPAGFVIVGMAAVFAGAGRVPIATILMVAEMTGGYALLVPASLAAVISFLVQRGITSKIKSETIHDTLFESQVNTRSDSPAHMMEHMQKAVKLLRQQKAKGYSRFNQFDLMTLLRNGVTLDLPDGNRFYVAKLAKESIYVARPVSSAFLDNKAGKAALVAVIRGDEVLLSDSDDLLKADDQVVIICMPEVWSGLRKLLDWLT
ncbi:MAG: chloride channel protein [Thermodesulfobacteriota bacterium]